MSTTHLIDSDGETWNPGCMDDLWIRPNGQGEWNSTDERGDADCEDCCNAYDEDAWNMWNDAQPDAWQRFQDAAEHAARLDAAHAPLY